MPKTRCREGVKLKTIDPMSIVQSYIMPTRIGSSNTFSDSIEISACEDLIRRKRAEGLKGIGMLHIFLAAYTRMLSQRPGINRFIRGQKTYKRNRIEICLTVKKDFQLDAQETVVKLITAPDDTLDGIYEKLTVLLEDNRTLGDQNGMDNIARLLSHIPGVLLKFAVWLLRTGDYFGLLPRGLTEASPFHASMFITNMGSLGIPPIYHHLYDFGNVPVFLAIGAKRKAYTNQKDGSVKEEKLLDFTVVCDERICDGHYYASAFKYLKTLFKNPELLEQPPEQVLRDID